jgi:outer membrane immunogenic protein
LPEEYYFGRVLLISISVMLGAVMKRLTIALLAVSSLSLGLSQIASAADMPVKAPVYKAPVAAPAYTWTGCYVGGHVGGGWGRSDFSDPDREFFARPGEVIRVDTSGVLGGGQVGCDWQFAPNWVIGIEGAAAGADIKGSTDVVAPDPFTTGTLNAKTDFLASVTGRLGWTSDRWMLFGKGGVAWAHDKYSFSGQTQIPGCFAQPPGPLLCAILPSTPFDYNKSQTQIGWTIGAGVEWAFLNNWSVKLEYDFYDFGSRQLSFVDSTGNFPQVVPVDIDQRIHTVKFGVNYRFN